MVARSPSPPRQRSALPGLAACGRGEPGGGCVPFRQLARGWGADLTVIDGTVVVTTDDDRGTHAGRVDGLREAMSAETAKMDP
jgi:hypothetical protein